MENLKISVIIPVLNSMKYLSTCLESVNAAINHYGNGELIVADNGSTDSSYEWVSSNYGDTAKRFQLRGVTIAALRNRGAKLAQGEYLAFIDSDCVVAKDYLAKAVEILTSVDADAVGCNAYRLPASPHWIERTWDQINRLPVNTFVPYLLSGSLLIKKVIFEKVGGFDERLVTGEDTEFGLRLNASGFKAFASSAVTPIHLGNPKTITEFFEKQAWHGLGMFGTFKVSPMDKPLAMTLAHLFLTTVGTVGLFAAPLGLAGRVALLGLSQMLAPLVTVVYRTRRWGRLIHPLRCILLYHLYYTARCVALFKIFHRRLFQKTSSF